MSAQSHIHFYISWAKQFAAERRTEIDDAVKRMKADAATAEEKLWKLNEAGPNHGPR